MGWRVGGSEEVDGRGKEGSRENRGRKDISETASLQMELF